jgi:hypothetical protein
MVKRISLVIVICAFSMLDSAARTGALPPDTIDWTKGTIVTHGTCRVNIDDRGTPVNEDGSAAVSLTRGRVDAYRKARERAMEGMVRLVKNVRVDADTTLSELLEHSDVFQSRIVAVINAKMKSREFPVDFATSGCRAELRIGDLLPAVPYTYPGDEFPARIDAPIPTDYTSLIIDTRALAVEPMILPSVLNEDGLEVYGRFFVDIRSAGRYGIVAYAHGEDEAMKYRTAGDRPFYTVALRAVKGCPVIADRDVRKLFSSGRTVEQLKKCRVIFIIDKKGKA